MVNLQASPRQLKSVLRDLDNLISTAAEENQLLSRRSSFLLKGRCSVKKRIGYSLQVLLSLRKSMFISIEKFS